MNDPTFRLEPSTEPGRAARGPLPPTPSVAPPRESVLGFLTSARFGYAAGFVLAATLLWLRFNPEFGNVAYATQGRKTPLQFFQDANGDFVFSWSLAQRAVVFLLLLAGGFLTLAMMRASTRRGVVGLVLCLIAFATIAPPADQLAVMMLYVSAGMVCGAMFVPQARATLWTRRVFWTGLLLLACVLFLPLPLADGLEHVYRSAGAQLVGNVLEPPTHIRGEELDGPFARYAMVLYASLPQLLGFFVLLMAALVAWGSRSVWPRRMAALTLLLLVAAVSYAHFLNHVRSGEMSSKLHLPWWQAGLHELGDLWWTQFTIFTLPLAAALHDATRRHRD